MGLRDVYFRYFGDFQFRASKEIFELCDNWGVGAMCVFRVLSKNLAIIRLASERYDRVKNSQNFAAKTDTYKMFDLLKKISSSYNE